jgi:glucosamine 6-phosphate synthetase-like amidotransferase/phosphosugar isomerase protein
MELDYSYKLYKKRLRSINVRIPINEKGEYDLEKQKEIANQHNYLYQTKNKILEELKQLSTATVLM